MSLQELGEIAAFLNMIIGTGYFLASCFVKGEEQNFRFVVKGILFMMFGLQVLRG